MMPRDLDHLELRRISEGFPRRKKPGRGIVFPRENPRSHGEKLLAEVDAVTQSHRRRRPAGISPTLVFRIKFEDKCTIDDEQLARMGLQVISRDPDKTVVVFSSDEELREFRRYMREFSGLAEGRVHEYKFMGSIRELERLRPEDRKGRLLQAEPLGDGEIAPLDIEIMHPGDRQQCQQYIRELTNLAEQYNGRLSDFYTGDSLCLARCQANPELLNELLSTDYVMEVDRRPRPTFDQALLYETRLQDIGDVPDVPEDAPGVLVMDSGVMSNHPLIRPALGEAEVFPGSMDTRITGGAEDGDTTDGGHGTKVCGIAIYGDVATCITTGVFQPKVRLFSARVLDDNCEYDEETLVEKQFELAIHYFITNYPECKVINLSLGDEKLFYRDGQKQFRLAAKIDEMALKYQDRNIVFTVSAGNYRYQPPNPEDLKTDYPDYLLNHAEARIIDPATSAIALTVGSLSTGNVPFYAQRFPGDVCEAIAGTAKFPSPFTRTGFGPDGIIKPEIVDYGGDYVFSKRNPDNRSDPGLGVPTLSRDFAPPESRLFTTGVGTSYSAPAVANLAARLFDRFPGATSNLIRALIVDSARIPDLRPDILNSDPSDESVLRVYGYGQPNFEAAAFSDQSEVLLVAEDKLSIDKFHLYEIPPLPPEFKKLNGDRYLSVTLAFDPPTRHTRGEYCGVRMGFEVFRNVAADEVSAAYLDWKRLEGRDDLQELERKLKDFLSSQRVKLKPGSIIRSKGTVQKGTTKIGDRWTYEGDPMIISVATLKRSWLPEIYDAQRYALVVSIRHSSPDIRLYDRIRQHTRVAERIRIRV